MAILMIYDKNNTHPDPVKDSRGCYKRGDIVQVFEDGTPLVLPPAPPFVFIKVTGITKTQAEKFMEPEVDMTDPLNPVITRRRRWGFLWSVTPTIVKNALANSRYYEVSLAGIRNYIENKTTGQKA